MILIALPTNRQTDPNRREVKMSHRPRLPILSAVVYSLIVSFTPPSKTEAVPRDLNLENASRFFRLLKKLLEN